MNGTTAYALSKQYVADTADSLGSLKGAPCTIKSQTETDDSYIVTFEWTGTSGAKETSQLTIKKPKDGIDGLPGKDGKDGLNGKDGSDGIGISKIEKISTVDLVDTYRITFTDNSTFDYEVTNGKDGQGGGTADVPIEKIKVNGELQTPVNKVVDITVPEAYDDTDIRTELANKSDKDHTHTTVNGHTVESDVPVDAKFTDTVYNDAQIKSQIQAVANGLMDSVGYSADYKTIDIIAKNGVKKSVNVAPIISHASITELSDVDTTNKATGKALVYNATTSKHEYADVSGTDEKVKMDASTDAKYLGELLDNITIANENGELKVKKLDGQEVTITEINYLKGLTMNVMDLVNMFSNGGVKIINTPVATYAELLTIDKSSFIEGISYLVYVLADENHDNAKTTYLVDKDSATPTYFGFADSQRDFTTNPIDLATEITGKLGISNMDSDAIKALFTVDDTYKTETATNNAFSTHGAKALYDELLLAIGNKANDSDLTAHKDDTDIHVSTEDRTKWDSAKTHADSAHAPSNAQANVIETVKVNGTALEVSDKAVNVTVPTTVSELTDSVDYAKTADIPTTLPANGGNSDTVNNHTVKSDVPENAVFTDTIYDDAEVKGSITELNSNLDELSYSDNGIENLCNPNKIERGLYTSTDTRGENYFHYEIEVTPNEYYSRTRFDGLTDYSGYCFSVLDENKNCIVVFANNERTIQIPSNGAYLWLQGGESAEQLKNMKYMVVKLQTPPTDYKPYIPSVKMLAEEVGKQNESLACNASKNMLLVNVGTISGVTITSKDKSTALLNGTNTSNVSVFETADVIPSGEYHIKVSNRVGALYVWDLTHSKTIIEVDNTECNFTLTEPSKLVVGFSIGSGHSFTNFEVSGQLEKGTVATDFVPYNGKSNLELTNDVVSLKNDLNTLEFGEIAGCKNLFNGNFFEKVLDTGINYTDVDLSKEQNSIKDIKGIKFAVFGAYLKKGTYTFSYTNDAYFSLNRIAIAGTDCILAIESIRKSYTWTQNVDGWTYFGIEGDDSETGVTDTPFSITPDIQIEEGTQATPYEPYIPSVKMLADEVSEQNESLSVIGKCKNLLNPTLGTTTQNGVTCTANGDGTYTINGTNNSGNMAYFRLSGDWLSSIPDGIYKIIGIPKGLGGKVFCYVQEYDGTTYSKMCRDVGDGNIFNTLDYDRSLMHYFYLAIATNTTVDNIIIKPMLTANLTATYDDFAPYTGDGETLTHDVAKLNESLGAYDINENVIGSYSKSNGFAIEWIKMCKATKGTYKLSYTINGSTGNTSEIALGKAIDDKSLYRNNGIISDGIYEQIINITSDTDVYIMAYTNGSFTISDIKFTLQNIANEVGNLKNDLSNFTSGLYIDGDTDWNTMKTSGMYYYNGWSGSGGSNKPTETKSIGMVFVLNAGIRLLQFVVLESGNSYFRSGTVDELGNWTTIS